MPRKASNLYKTIKQKLSQKKLTTDTPDYEDIYKLYSDDVSQKDMKIAKIFIPELNEYKNVMVESSRKIIKSPQELEAMLSSMTEETRRKENENAIITVDGKQMKKIFVYIPELNEYKQVLVDASREVPMSKMAMERLLGGLTQETITKQFGQRKMKSQYTQTNPDDLFEDNDVSDNSVFVTNEPEKKTKTDKYENIFRRIDDLYADILIDEDYKIGEDISKQIYYLHSEGPSKVNSLYSESPSEFSDMPELPNEEDDINNMIDNKLKQLWEEDQIKSEEREKDLAYYNTPISPLSPVNRQNKRRSLSRFFD